MADEFPECEAHHQELPCPDCDLEHRLYLADKKNDEERDLRAVRDAEERED